MKRKAGATSNPLWRLAVGELVVGEFLPVGQAGVDVVEDVEVPLASVERHTDGARLFRSEKSSRCFF